VRVKIEANAYSNDGCPLTGNNNNIINRWRCFFKS